MNQIVQNYVLPDGNEPIVEWLAALQDIKGRAKIRARINQIRAGNPGKFNTVAPGIMEMKIDFGPGYRVYYARVGKRVILLLCGGDKQTQRADIKKATEFLSDYKRRMQEHD
ncbi:MAG: addiction module protein [Candidatus Riflebacteria bacterium HGW-Riflebacteria-2]|jgi:putative addiction module killer protein|nr:MAG: addiction module protein [Candidatus Riflebacteria bacterium HGW-Riflebacteria-2]